jgi:pyrroloquinoline quinone (PQQ) biosynthesis protein C
MNRCRNTGIEHKKPAFSPESLQRLRNEVDAFLDTQIEKFNATVPYAQHFEKDAEIHQGYYRRHLIETAYRIRLLRIAESKALAEIAKLTPEGAQIWANYETEEMIHDEMFIADLRRALGCTREEALEEALKVEPYLSTKLLAGFFSYLLDHEGPLGVVAYSYLVEYVNVKLDPKKIAGLRKSMGRDKIKGQIAHNHTDENDDHPGEVWQVICHLLRDDADIDALYRYLDEHQRVLVLFFEEMYQDQIAAKAKAA